ncbi:MAG: membrane dipeptidase [Acidobacteria bacterium RIFCSPLOWO2_12_FULL_67_14]|nr:MAG: membrane dipeptidase [Acidobacteria bacterium RIFCSPLOWO2_02_FULL_67_21]OFW39351.1 MAG: membrane dipeptidase [Acidobacteria bacterium RIFCSPLOWO2_12_FULL_67_14]
MLSATAGVGAGQQPDLLTRARALHRQTPLIDGHNDYPWALRQHDARRDLAALDISIPQPGIHTDIPRLRAGGVGGQFWSVYIPVETEGPAAIRATLEQIDIVHRMAARYPDTFGLATSAADVERIFKSGRIASLIGMEGGHSIDGSLAALRMFHQAGARYMTLTHSANVPWADSGTDTPRSQGLSTFGEEVVREMNRLGMLVDLSHTSPDTMDDALRVSEAPVIFSHSDARALHDHRRNVPDGILRRLPANGGVVMVTFVPGFLTAGGKATLADVAAHMDHVRRVAGPDHVGIGSDFDGIETVPAGLEDVSKYPALTAELLRRGWPEQDVRKALGLNVLRVMRRAETVAARLQKERPPSLEP